LAGNTLCLNQHRKNYSLLLMTIYISTVANFKKDSKLGSQLL
jgi:hypothetical protein